ncbi:hypothetical protein [Nostoc sp. UHCC 0251]|uniref:hypothetical protein n=1 Tax=Nostoc sp. UHCC 0251 TaxID=3110240 RepID=UPI002B21C9C8|nr:hypothetical protein [Nostoc sp. UHCC 0251]MEA5625839.1 hypothetical protein [Nostoc sp. UHCC 0251]
MDNSIQRISDDIASLKISSDALTRDMVNIHEVSKNVLPQVRNEVDRMTSYNQGLHKLFIERLDGIKQDLDGLRDRDIKSLATTTELSEVNSKVESLPKLHDFTNEHSPLATKAQLLKMQEDTAWLKGAISTQFIGVIAAIALLIGMWINLSSTLSKVTQVSSPSPQQSTQTAQPKVSP